MRLLSSVDDLVRQYSAAPTIGDLDTRWVDTEHDRHVLELAHWRRALEAYTTRRAHLAMVVGIGERGA